MPNQKDLDELLDDEQESPKSLSLPPEADPVIDQSIPKVAAEIKSPFPLKKTPDRRGKKEALKDRLYDSLGVSRKHTPRITRRRTAIYQLVKVSGLQDLRLEGIDRVIMPPPWDLVPTFTFTDTDELDLMKREKTMTYYAGGTETVYVDGPVKGKPVPMAIPKIGAPIFVDGQLTVNIYNEYPKYAWLELHPRNRTNKWRDQALPPIFERVDQTYDSPHVAGIRMDLQRDAENYVLRLKPNEMIDLASRLTNPTMITNIGPQELRLALRMRARQNAEEVLFTAPDHSGSIKIGVIHALDLGILTFIPQNEAYYLDGEDPIFQVPVGNDPFTALVEFFHTHPEGKEFYGQVKEELDFWF